MVLFKHLERLGININNDLLIYVLQFMFMLRIQAELLNFRITWNGHCVTTERNRTPDQLMVLGRNTFPAPLFIDPDVYGLDDDNDDNYNEFENGDDEHVGPGHHMIVNPPGPYREMRC